MARFLAFDWDAGHVHLLSGSLGKSGVALERAVTWPEEQPPSPSNADAFGQRLHEKLKEFGVSSAPLLVTVGRDRVILKEVRYPAVPAHEEPGIVRFQAVKELTDGADEVVIDYQAADVPEPSGERRALAVAFRRDLLQAYQTMAKAAGLKLAAVTPRSFGVLASLQRTASPQPEPGTAFALLSVGDKSGEFAVVRGTSLAFARTLSGPALNSDTALLGEIRRNLAVYAGQAGQFPVKALYVAEAEGLTLGVSDRIREALTMPVYRFDPLSGLEPPTGATVGAFAGVAGLLQLYSRSTALPVNFVKPREPKAPRDPNRRVLIAAASILALLALGAGAWGYGKLAAKDAELARLAAMKKNNEEQLLGLDLKEKRIIAVDNWLATDVVWLDEMYNLTARFPNPQPVQLTKLIAHPNPNYKPGVSKDKHVGQIKLEGVRVADSKPMNELTSKLNVDSYLSMKPLETKPLQGGARGGAGGRGGGPGGPQQYVQTWTMIYDLEKRAPDKFSDTFKADIPERRNTGPQQADWDLMWQFGFGGMTP